MYCFLGAQSQQLGIINLTYSRQFKQNIKYKRYRQWGIRFFIWKTPTNCKDKKLRGLRPTNLNPLFKIKLHRFTWPFYPKELLFNAYNLIYVYDAIIHYCSLVDPSITPKGLRFSIHDSNIKINEWDIRNEVAK